MFDELFKRKNKNKVDIKKLIPNNLPKLIHVGGTNGKGSCCSYLECILMQRFKVGKFTSPHLLTAYERITINQENIKENEFKSYYNKYKDLELGFFEFFFVVAMNYFVDKKVDIAIVEVGIGGLHDTTNILDYDSAIITSISLDHTNLLGNTLDKIAYQKAGIFKNNTVCYYNDRILDKFLNKKAIYVERNTTYKNILKGDKQQDNFALCHRLLSDMGITENEIEKGLNNLKIHGRQEYIKENVLIDVSHNVDSIKFLVDSLDKTKDTIVYLSALQDKDIEKMAEIIEKHFKLVIVELKDDIRGRTKKSLQQLFKNKEIATGIPYTKGVLNVYCGSFHFIQRVLEYHIN